jgi:rubrerythrin
MLLQDALGTAIEYEHRVRDHYAECAKKATDPVAQRIFAILAREEQGHVEYLEARLDEWRTTGVVQVAELKSLLPPGALVQAAAQKASKNAQPSPVAKAEIDFLKEALELERKTSAFYQELVAKLEPKHRALFERFLEIEEGHVTIVQAEIDAVAGHGHWFDFMEFSLEK